MLEGTLPEHSTTEMSAACASLDDHADSATVDATVSQEISTLSEVTIAIQRLKNGRADGADGNAAELLKGAEKPVSKALCKLIINVWSMGRFPAE